MKKGVNALLCVFFAALCFVIGMFVGKNIEDGYVPLAENQSAEVDYVDTVEDDFRLDINSASKIQLMELQGIGELLAERIIVYREANGPFHTTDELLNVEGIGEKKLQAITDWIKVSE